LKSSLFKRLFPTAYFFVKFTSNVLCMFCTTVISLFLTN